jgi:hypothetical protein
VVDVARLPVLKILSGHLFIADPTLQSRLPRSTAYRGEGRLASFIRESDRVAGRARAAGRIDGGGFRDIVEHVGG